jgi:hypothetical protein
MVVILNEVKNLDRMVGYKSEILRRRLRMTLRHSLDRGEETGGGKCPIETRDLGFNSLRKENERRASLEISAVRKKSNRVNVERTL